ncbi:MAG: hypothetical protein R6V77_07260 [Candidatus Cloacimonadaceae bacterium]
MNNDLDENDGGWFDNRLQLNLAAKLSQTTSIGWSVEVGDILWTDLGNRTPALETRELYIDYEMNWMDLKIRTGQQYWMDHRALILDDYYSGISADLNLAGISTELGFMKSYEGALNKLDDAHVAFANFMFAMPIDWGLTAMFGQCHDDNEADIWVIPYFMLNFDPVMLDLTAVLNHQMYKVAGEDESEMGIAFAAKAEVDVTAKIGLDFLYVTEEGINTLSPYYENGLYLFGNMLPYDGVQIHDDIWMPYGAGDDPYMSIVGKFSYPLNEKTDIFAAGGMVTKGDPWGMEFNVGVDYRINNYLSFNPVLAVGQTGEGLEPDNLLGEDQTNFVYMLGGLLKAEF